MCQKIYSNVEISDDEDTENDYKFIPETENFDENDVESLLLTQQSLKKFTNRLVSQFK